MRAVDLFAGWGGFTAGATAAGARVVLAANHWPLAVAAHRANHPEADHVCQDLRQADWSALPDYDALLASPACQGHSQAAQPSRARSRRTRHYHDALRATAWAVVDCAEVTRPRVVVVENVPDFARWALYDLWAAALRRLGYRVHTRTLSASVHGGVPQRRERLFVVAVRGRQRAAESSVLDLPEGREPAFGPCVQWDDPGPWWTHIDASTPRVRERIAAGRANHGRRFLTQHVSGHPGVPLGEPIRTITTKDQWAVVDGEWYRPLTIRENARAMGFSDSYAWPTVDPTTGRKVRRSDAIRGLGNAVPPPLAARVVARVGGVL